MLLHPGGLPAPAVHCPQSHHYCCTGIPVPYSRGYVQSLSGSSERSTYIPASNILVSHQTASTLGCHTSRNFSFLLELEHRTRVGTQSQLTRNYNARTFSKLSDASTMDEERMYSIGVQGLCTS